MPPIPSSPGNDEIASTRSLWNLTNPLDPTTPAQPALPEPPIPELPSPRGRQLPTRPRHEERSPTPVSPAINIGQDLQAIIYSLPDFPETAFKKERPGNAGNLTNLDREWKIHLVVEAAWEGYTWAPQGGGFPPPGTSASHQKKVLLNVRVPMLVKYYSANGARQTLWRYGYPAGDSDPTSVVEMERIEPLSREERERFARQVYEGDVVEEVLSYGPNEHCLVRPYLGKHSGGFGLLGREASMRNLPVYLDDLEKLGEDVEYIAREMGRAFGVMHWGAGVDGDDVEFVLGTSVLQLHGCYPPHRGPIRNFRTTGLWLLGFRQCKTVDLHKPADVVYQAFSSAMVTGNNQLFIPSVGDGPLWNNFSHGYTQAAEKVIYERRLGERFSAKAFLEFYKEYAWDIRG
ncbi:hypothetical protein QBC34DRAFT_454293 [Podospora aff. communis PSN243]|uniref:DUF3669 domain-containing protein n=1 Tax=Podospora aff. communis PSN243 TaxID=3040156 RepID=A0AAV9GYN8_9PEZI|nr:hypothetical protein QBC34DRAFT_454293 [Podospora aff. communis PSN243]